jgi:hypothetical protein
MEAVGIGPSRNGSSNSPPSTVRKGRPITFDLPPVETAPDISKALGVIAKSMAAGELTPDEAGKAARQSISDAEASFGHCEQHTLPSDASQPTRWGSRNVSGGHRAGGAKPV